MNIVVALRLVPDASGELEIAEGEKDIDREWIDMRLNDFDDYALEEAILLKERSGAKVIAVAIVGEGADRMLQGALARGADEAVKIAWDQEAAPAARTAARLFACAARELSADLFLTGVQTPEDIYGQLAPLAAADLDWPCVSSVNGIQLFEGGVELTQELSEGATAKLRVKTPAVAGVQTPSQPVRYVAGSKLREAASRKIPTLDATGEDASDPSELLRISLPENAQGVEMLASDAKSAADSLQKILAERGLLKA